MIAFNELLAKLNASTGDEERSWITLEFSLDRQTEAIRAAVSVAAILNWFDAEMLNGLLDAPLSKDEFKTLTGLPYIEKLSDRGWNLHEKAREQLRSRLWKEPQRARLLSRRAATWCRKFHPADITWRAEGIYHSLLARERKAEEAFVNALMDWTDNNEYSTAERLVENVLSASKAGFLEGRVIAWARYFQARFQYLNGKLGLAHETCAEALSIHSDQDLLAAHIHKLYGDIYIGIDITKAREHIQAALKMFAANNHTTGIANCHRSLGDIEYHSSNFSKARNHLAEAMRVYRGKNILGEANCLSTLGDIHAIAGNYEQGVACHQSALALYSKRGELLGQANTRISLGEIYAKQWKNKEAKEQFAAVAGSAGGRLVEANLRLAQGLLHLELCEYDTAEYYIHAALELNRSVNGPILLIANCKSTLGYVHLRLGNFQSAKVCFEEGIKVSQRIEECIAETNCIKGLALCSAETGDYSAALDLANATISKLSEFPGLEHSVAFAIATKGEINDLFNKHNVALEAYTAALDLVANEFFYVERAATLLHMRDLTAAEQDLASASNLNPFYYRKYLVEGQVKLYQQQAEPSLESFKTALKNCPEDGDIFMWQSIAFAVLNRDWKRNFDAGIERTYLLRKIDRLLQHIDQLIPLYFNSPLSALRSELEKARHAKIVIS